MVSKELELTVKKLIELSQNNHINIMPPDDALINSYQKEIGFCFSDDYKFFLKNASTIFYGTIDPLVITSDKSNRSELSKAIVEARAIGVPQDWLPICEDNGDYYCLTDHGICFWSSDGSSSDCWSDLSEWIKKVWIANA